MKIKILPLILLSAIISLSAFSDATKTEGGVTAPDCPECAAKLTSGLTFVGEASKKAMVKDVALFCKEQTYLGAYNSTQDFILDNTKNWLSLFEDDQKAFQVLSSKSLSPWQKTLFPNEELRRNGFEEHSDLRKQISGGKILQKKLLASDVSDCLKRSCGINSGGPIKYWDDESISQKKEVQLGLTQSYILCGQIALFSVKICSEGMQKVLEWMRPKKGWTLLPLWNDVLENPKYEKPLIHAAEKMLKQYEKGETPTTHFFDDIKSAFKAEGFSEQESEDLTWNTIAIISTGGANTSMRAFFIKTERDSQKVKMALSVLSYLPSIFDSQTMASGQPYSYPPNVKTTCDFGKPYHFWMAAYLTRRLTLEGGDTIGSAAAVFTVQKGYEMKKEGNGRDPDRAFRVDTFDSFNNVMRMDLAFAGAGAWYGALAAQNQHTNKIFEVDKAVQKLVEDAEIVEPVSYKESKKLWKAGFPSGVTGFNRWNRIFSPNSSFKFYEESVK